jgi:O-antigen ligase
MDRLQHLRKLIVPALFLLAAAMPMSIAAMNIAIAVLLSAWLGTATPEERRRGLWAALPLLPFAAGLALAWAANGAGNLSGFRPLWGLLALPLVFAFLPLVDRRQWLLVFASAALVAAVVGGLQFAAVKELAYMGIRGTSRAIRASGFFINPMTFAGVFMLATVVFGWIFTEPGRYRRFFAFMLPISMAALVVSITRSAWIGMAVAIPFIVYGRKRAWLWLTVWMIVAAAVVYHTPRMIGRLPSVTTVTENPREAVGVRSLLWQHAYDQFRAAPLFGKGFGTYGPTIKERYPAEIILPKPHAHNNFLQFMAESGAVGLLGFLVMAGWIVRRHWQCRHFSYRSIGLGTGAAFLAAGLFEYNFGDTEVLINLMVWTAMVWAVSHPAGDLQLSSAHEPAATLDPAPS